MGIWGIAQVDRLVLTGRIVGLVQRLRGRRGDAHRHLHAVHRAVGVGDQDYRGEVALLVGGRRCFPAVGRVRRQVHHVGDGGARLRHRGAHDGLGGLALRGELLRLLGRRDGDFGEDRLLRAVRVNHLHGDRVLAGRGACGRVGGEPAGACIRSCLRGPAGNGGTGGVDRRAEGELRVRRNGRVRLVQCDGLAGEGFLGRVGRLAHCVLALGHDKGVRREQVVDAAVEGRRVHGSGGGSGIRGHREGARVRVRKRGHRALLDYLACGFVAPDDAVARHRRQRARDIELRRAVQRRRVQQLVVVGNVQLHRPVGHDREAEVVEVVRRGVHARHDGRGGVGSLAGVVVVLLEHRSGERRIRVDLLAVLVRDPHVHARVAGEFLVAGAQGVLAVFVGLSGDGHRDRFLASSPHFLEHGLDSARSLRQRDLGIFFNGLDALLGFGGQHRSEDVVALEVGVAVARVAGWRANLAVALERVHPHETGDGVSDRKRGRRIGQRAKRIDLHAGGGHVACGGVYHLGEEDAGALDILANQLEHARRVRGVLARARRHADPGVGHDAAGLAGVDVLVARIRVDQVFFRHPQAVRLLAVAHAGGVEQVRFTVGVVEGNVVALFILDQVAVCVAHAQVESVGAGGLPRQGLGLSRVDGGKRAVGVAELHEHRDTVETHGVADARRRG